MLKHILFLSCLVSIQAFAQCLPSYNGLLCVDNPIEFDGNSQGASFFNWNFNGEGNNNTTNKPIFTFKTPGNKNIKYSCRLSNGDTCFGEINIVIKEKPKIRIHLINDSIQCYENNAFCFRDSSLSGDNNSCIISIKYLFSDGELITKYGTKFAPIQLPLTFCKTINDPQGKDVNLIVETEDCNGCISRYTYPYKLKVDFLPPMFVNYYTLNKACSGAVNIKFVNGSNIKQSDIQSFEWDFGDGTKNTTNWDSITHEYKSGDSLKRTFSPRLKFFTKLGCSRVLKISDILVFNLKPKITVSRDSFCVGDTFSFKIEPDYMKNFVTTRDIRWNFNPGISNEFEGYYSYSTLGPKRIVCTINHPCGPYSFADTLIVIGPQSIIEPEFLIDPNQRFQCEIKDSVKFYDQSLFYHNDKNMLDDDSLFRKTAGNLGHHFTNSNSTKYPFFKRENDHALRLWDFGDQYCENCTTDTKNNRNTWVNCRYSRDMNPTHWFTPWDSIYYEKFSNQFFNKTNFNPLTKNCEVIKIFASDSLYVIKDTLLIFGDNVYGNQIKDSILFKHLRKKKIPNGLFGKGSLDAPFNFTIFLNAKDSVFIDRKNGLPEIRIIGPTFYNVQENHELKIYSETDSCWFVSGLKIKNDSLPFNALKPYHKISQKIKNQKISPNDIVDLALHRQLFYNKIPACFDFKLHQKDFIHPLKCETEQTKSLSLLPPSAKKLAISNQYCYGYGNKIVEFSLSDTKPGCSQAIAQINFDFINTPNNFELINDLSFGNIKLNTFTNSSAPYSGYAKSGPFGSIFYHRYSDSTLPDKAIQNINVALIIGNGNGSLFCQDTIYYPNFASFTKLNTDFDFLGRKPNEIKHVCPNESFCVYVPKTNPNSNQLAESSTWSLINKLSLDTIQVIKETYFKVKSTTRFPNQLVNYTLIQRFQNEILHQTDTVFTAIVHRYHSVLLKGVSNNELKEKLAQIGLNYDELADSVIYQLLWNGVGTIGFPSTGSKGCIDTSTLINKLKFNFIFDSITYLSPNDTALLPVDKIRYNGIDYQSYCFKSSKSGPFVILREIESLYPNYCPKYTEEKVIVGFNGKIEFSDSIFCAGNSIEAQVKFRYYSSDPKAYGSLDTTDFWTIREANAGNPGVEGKTYWDYSQADDDKTNPNTIFGIMPYTRTGIGNPRIILGNEPGGIYYRTPGFYKLRTISSDSNRCVDTFRQNLYVLGPKAGFFIDLNAPNCKTIVELFDTSKIIDACVLRGLPKCDQIIYWKIDWGDGSKVDEYFKNRPNQIGHDYKKNGTFRIWFYISTIQGCKDSIFKDIFIPGPQPRFKVISSDTICVNDTVMFKNTSILPTSSAEWYWNYGDGFVQPQKDTGFITHQYKKVGTFSVVLKQFDSIANTGKYCVESYPDSFNKILIVVKPYDDYTLTANPQIVCVGDSVLINANVTSFNQYQTYQWQIDNEIPFKNSRLNQAFVLNRIGRFNIKFKPDTIGLNKLACLDDVNITVFADSVFADFEIDSLNMPIYCFQNTSKFGVSYRWGFYHDTDITQNKSLEFKENLKQNEIDKICEDYRKQPGEHWICLEAQNSIGCKDTICKKINNTFEQLVLPPNVFTPSGNDQFITKDKDGNEGNNVFNIYIKGEEYYNLVIYDRWGVKVFESQDKNIDWNGKLFNTGEKCSDGTYYYILKYRFKNNEKNEKILNGVVRLIW